MAGTHELVVADQAHAQALAEALTSYGFARVIARSSGSGRWLVTAFDEGPYPTDLVGQRGFDAAGRAAAALARQHGGYPVGGTRCEPSMLYAASDRDAPIVLTNPGSRPSIPTMLKRSAPPPARLAPTPDNLTTTGGDPLAGLDEVAWADLEHAHGSATMSPT